jgi:nitrogen fixation NifU-like protein
MNQNGLYSKKVIKHFNNPHNFGKIKNPDGVGQVGNILCGDVMWIYIKVGKDKEGQEIIENIKFETFGCVAALATSSMITDLAKGKNLKQALKIGRDEIVKALGGLPPIKIHCSVLATDALSEAIYDYLKKNKKDVPKDLNLKHERIKKALEMIEKRYKKYKDLERKISKNEKKNKD